MSPEKEPRHPFATRFTAERAQESLMFGLLRGMTFFVLFCAAFLFWDIISKGSSKVFEGDGLINWEFLTEHPQTLHVIGEGEDEIKLSSSNYYKLKDEKMLNKWGEFRQSDGHDSAHRELAARFSRLQNESSKDSLVVADEKFLLRERENATNKFAFWKEMLTDPKTTAEDFEIQEEEVPGMVTQFMLGHFEKERSRFSLVEEKVTLFRATHYPKIENLSLAHAEEVEMEYLSFLAKIPEAYNQSMASFGEEAKSSYEEFLQTEGPKEFGRFAEALVAYSAARNVLLGPDHEIENWEALQASLGPFKKAMTVSLPSKDYAYSGGGIFPAIIGTLLLVIGAMAIAIVLGVFCAIFLAEYGKAGKFLSMVRLAILNLAGVPSIIFGLFGFGLFVIFLDWNVSLLAGWFTLAFMVLPIVITASEEALRSIPQGFRESSLALGATKWTMIKTSVLPFAMPGILTSSILGVARAAGETAPIMFTAAYAKRSDLPWEGLEHWTDFFFQGVMALPYHIYVVSAKIPQNAYTADMQYGTAFVFLLLVVGVASLSIILRNRLRKKYRW